MEKINIAFEDFLNKVKQSETWATISREKKQYIYRARSDARAGKLGIDRFKKLADTYLPGEYSFICGVLLNSRIEKK